MIVKGAKINNRYSIIRTLGEGGMANVYLAYDTILDRNVAVKVLRGDLASDEKFVRRFQREALSASNLYHPNIVQIYDFDKSDEEYYIVMEYVEGRTLKQLLKKRGSLTITEVIDIMSQITDGMAHAHDSYIIHRDIKPQNIMILDNGMIKITDFGIAMALNGTQLTQTNSVMGSVHYLPPEQAAGKGSTIKSDIYSMGILMYELLTGEVPYKGDNAVEIALKHLKEPVPSIRKILPDIPQSIENIILKATAKNPENRYKDAREMHQDIITAMDESRRNEPRYVYPHSEKSTNLDDTKTLDEAVKEVKKQEEKERLELVSKEREENRKQNTLLIILASIFTGLVVLACTIVFLLPKISGSKTIKIPDVSKKSKSEAISILTKAGFEIGCNDGNDSILKPSETIEEGYVIKTDPEKDTEVKEGKKICLYVSSGEATLVMEDYKGQNIKEVKGMLSSKCAEVKCTIEMEAKKVDEKEEEKYKDNEEIIETLPLAGETVKKGDKIILYYPDIEFKYPNFTDASRWTPAKIDEYAKEKGITVLYEYKDNAELAPGTVIAQSREAGSVVQAGATITITVTRTPQVVDNTTLPIEGPDEGNND